MTLPHVLEEKELADTIAHHGPYSLYGGAETCFSCGGGWPCDSGKLAAHLAAVEVANAEPKPVPVDGALRPCPFCGGARAIVVRELRGLGYVGKESDRDAWAYFAICSTCAATGPWNKGTPAVALTAWNRRAAP